MPLIEIASGYALGYLATAPHASVVFLHGIMGSKKNLTGFIKRFVEELPHCQSLAFDLRNHGESSKHWSPFTVHAAAEDIARACAALDVAPRVLVGHSFGGKVALVAATLIPSIEALWLLDCSPGVIKSTPISVDTPSLNTLEIIEILQGIDWPLASRKNLVATLVERGVSNSIALWMTTNLVGDEDGVRLIFSLAELKEMLLDFVRLDGWPIIDTLASRMKIHLVAAVHGQRVTRVDEEALRRHAQKNGFFHVLDNSGHFVHADNPKGLIAIMAPCLSA